MSGKSILILEKNSDLVRIIGPFLNSQDYSVFATGKVSSAIKKTDNQKYDLILIDTSLGLSQIGDFLKQTTQLGALNRATSILLTTEDLDFELSIDEAKKIHKVLVKPYSLPDLLGNITELAA